MDEIFACAKRALVVVASLAFFVGAQFAVAQTASQAGLDKGQYIPNIWVDPDGCEHWVMDDGIEGYMTPHVTRDGLPVCRDGSICGLVKSDTFFASGSFQISSAGIEQLRAFFQDSEFRTFSIVGHTDNVSSEDYNTQLSRNRANAVADVARASGARISSVKGYGESKPAASNNSSAGRAKNRRVEIVCVN